MAVNPQLWRHLSAGLVLSAGSMCLIADAAAQARALDLQISEEQGFGRIIASWEDGDETAPAITASMTGPVLVLRFDQEVALDVEALKQGLPSYIAVARLSGDGREARLALSREYRIHQSTSYDWSGIDLVRGSLATDPPDIVSPLAAVKEAEAIAAAEAAEAARLAALPPAAEVSVRGSESGDYSTLAFYWPEKVDFTKENLPNGLRLQFERRAEMDLTRVNIEPPTGLSDIRYANPDQGLDLTIELQTGYWASAIPVDDSVLIRIREGQRPPEGATPEDVILPAALEAIAAELPPEGIEPPSKKPPPPAAFAAAVETPTARDEPPVSSQVVEAALSDIEPTPTAEPEVEMGLADITPPRNWTEALPRSGKVPVTMSQKGRGFDIDLAFARDIPGVVFRRNGTLWLAYPAAGEFDFTDAARSAGTRVDQVRSDSGMALRINVPDDLLVQVAREGSNWKIEMGGEGSLATRFLNPRRVAGDGGSAVVVNVPDIGNVFSLVDPDVGDKLYFAPVMNPTSAMANNLSFVEASLPATSHGLVVVPRTDDLQVTQRGEDVYIGSETGIALSAWGVETQLTTGQTLTPGFLDFASWRRGDKSAFWSNHTLLSEAAAGGDLSEWSGQSALLELARFYLSWELAAEAYGPLHVAAAEDPLLEQDAQWLALKGAADIMMGRYPAALETLEKSAVRSDPAAEAWRGLAFAETGEWRKARQAFITADPLLNAYSPEWSGRFHAAAARANVRMGDAASAERHAAAAKRSEDPIADVQANLTLGELAIASGRLNDARDIFDRLANHSDANVRVRAELAGIKLGLETGRISALDASDRLDTLRFRWRGDALELEIVAELSDVLFQLGQFRESLTLAQSFATQFPDLAGARDLRISLTENFESLFLDGKADKLDPISALALYYEFKDLTPIGPDGDRMIRKLANRLIAFDLLDPATELLAHQVDNRNLIGAGRAQIAADLAAIYLLDDRPEEALRTLSTTRQMGLDDETRLERRLLEAAAHMELQRFGHAIELLETLDNRRSKDLLAEVHWRARTWGAAGRALRSTLPEPGEVFQPRHVQTAIRAAVAYRLDNDMDGLRDLRGAYGEVMANTDQAETFEMLTGDSNPSSARLSDTIRSLADTSTADAFVASLKRRFEGGA